MKAEKKANATLVSALEHARGLHEHLPRSIAAPIQGLIERIASPSPTALSVLYETDKGPHGHNYTPHYRSFFGPLRRQRLTLLEIGVLRGASLRMWHRFLPRARIIGIDLDPGGIDLPGVEVYAGDQSDREFVAEIARRCGPFDIVIDDGSHVAGDIQASFEVLFPALTPGGWYVIEDLETAYAPEREGGPPGTPGTAIDLVRSLIDRTQAASGRHQIRELHLFNEIVFIRTL